MSEGLTVRAHRDGTWLEFKSSTGKSAVLRMETFAQERGSIIGAAINEWCQDRQAEVAHEELKKAIVKALSTAPVEQAGVHDALFQCESVLQLCSERIASDRVALDAIVDAFDKQKPNPKLAGAKAQQESVDRYVFKAIDDARKSARAILRTQPAPEVKT